MTASSKLSTDLDRKHALKQQRSTEQLPIIEGLEPRQLLSAAINDVVEDSLLHVGASPAAVTMHDAAPAAGGASSLAGISPFTTAAATTTAVTSSAEGNTSVYGTSVTFTATVTGTTPTGTVTFFDGVVSLGTGTAVGDGTWTLAISTLNAAVHNITATYGGDTNNAGSTSPILAATVTAKALTVSGITASNKVYDGTATATLSTTNAALVGVLAGDTANVTLGKTNAAGAFSGANAGTGLTVTVSGLTISGSAAVNYTLTQPTTTADITTKPLTVTGITAAAKVYNGSTAATLTTGAAALTGVLAGDVANVTLVTSGATGTFSSAAVGTGKTVTVAGLTLSGSASANYSITAPTATANITAKALTVTGITAADKVYDGTTAATLNFSGAILSGVLASDAANVTLGTSGATGTFSSKNIGTGLTVTLAGLTLTGTAATNYTITQPTTTADITAKALTVTGITAANKVYDGTATATLSTNGAALSGVATGESVTLVKTSATGTFGNANAGTGKTVTVAGLTISGTAAANYTLTQPTTTAAITPKAITAGGLTASNKTYDGATTATINTGSGSLTGLVPADVANVTIAGGTGTFASANVANNIKVTVAVTLGGSAGGNYTATSPTVTANITPLALTVTGVTADKVYDGTTKGAPLNTTDAALVGVLAVDAGKVTVAKSNGSTPAFSNAAALTSQVVTVSGLTLSGTSAKNYSLTQPSVTAHITKKALTVTGVTGVNKVYDGTTTGALTATNAKLSGVVTADKNNVTLVSGTATGTFASANVGTKITETVSGLTLSGSAAGNYTVTQPTTTANITPKTITVTGLTANNKEYDGTTTATLSTGSAALSGVVLGDLLHVILITDTGTGTFASKNVGTGIAVKVQGLLIVGSQAGNYTLTQPSPTANITALALTVTGITASDMVYNGTTSAGVDVSGATLSGFLSADKNGVKLVTTGATGTFSSKDVGDGLTVTVGGLTLTGSAAANYSITAPTTTASITPKALTVTGITADKVYDGSTVATLNTASAALSGVVAADAANVTLGTGSAAAGAFGSANVGSYSITVSGLTISGSAASDYSLTQPTVTAAITPKAVTISGVTAASKPYDGNTSATLDASGAVLTGVLVADNANVTLDSSAETGTFASKNAGAGVAVAISGLTLTGSAAANYTVTQPATTADITKKTITVTGMTAANKVYDGTTTATIDTTSASFTGVLASDMANVTISTATGVFSSANVGTGLTVTITVVLGGSAGGNYSVTPATTTANITPLAITASGIVADKVYDGTTVAVLTLGGATLTGVVEADTANVSLSGTGGTFASQNVGTGIAVTPTALTLTGSAAANYTLTAPTITANITAKALTVTGITAQDKAFDGNTTATLVTTGATLVGVTEADTGNVTLVTTNAVGTFSQSAIGSNLTVTISGLTITGSGTSNYTLTQPTTTASIT